MNGVIYSSFPMNGMGGCEVDDSGGLSMRLMLIEVLMNF